ncbi:hypothetical protein RRG08_064626 [Elysia crispata]|uniref:Uncharacterized protein n=1 Tax=Elysia crispata TaxID=231223 RepID=A0AAE1EDI3_9GAST|nr:hypothetical protein RRG08_064626 [Elysia crispata]
MLSLPGFTINDVNLATGHASSPQPKRISVPSQLSVIIGRQPTLTRGDKACGYFRCTTIVYNIGRARWAQCLIVV